MESTKEEIYARVSVQTLKRYSYEMSCALAACFDVALGSRRPCIFFSVIRNVLVTAAYYRESMKFRIRHEEWILMSRRINLRMTGRM